MKSKIRAPKKLSTAIMMAVADLEKAELDPKYEIDMGEWYSPVQFHDASVCGVCFAGSVMAGSCGVKSTEYLWPNNFNAEWERTFFALDYIRRGNVERALYHFYNGVVSFKEFLAFETYFACGGLDYEFNPTEFKNAMIDVAAMLESLGY